MAKNLCACLSLGWDNHRGRTAGQKKELMNGSPVPACPEWNPSVQSPLGDDLLHRPIGVELGDRRIDLAQELAGALIHPVLVAQSQDRHGSVRRSSMSRTLACTWTRSSHDPC